MKNSKKISNTQFAHLIERGALIVDLRKEAAFSKSHIHGAVNLCLDNIESQIETLNKELKPIVFYSHSGTKSKAAIDKLADSELELYDAGSLLDIDSSLISVEPHDSYGQRNIGDSFR